MDEAVRQLLDKQACAEVMMTYCRAIDRCDERLLRSVFHPNSYHRHGFEGPSSDKAAKGGDFVGFALGVLANNARTHHQLGNIFIELEDDGVTAYTEAYFTAYHRMRAKGDPKAAANAFDTEMDYWVGGRYMDRMEKRNGVWKIAYRVGTTDWTRLEPPSSQGFVRDAELTSKQSRKDMVYRRRTAFKRPT